MTDNITLQEPIGSTHTFMDINLQGVHIVFIKLDKKSSANQQRLSRVNLRHVTGKAPAKDSLLIST